MIVQFEEAEYCIDKLATSLEYFAVLRSSTFGESAKGRIDLTHRGRAVKLVLDMTGGKESMSAWDLASSDLVAIRPILDEFLAAQWLREHVWEALHNKRREEEAVRPQRVRPPRKKRRVACAFGAVWSTSGSAPPTIRSSSGKTGATIAHATTSVTKAGAELRAGSYLSGTIRTRRTVSMARRHGKKNAVRVQGPVS